MLETMFSFTKPSIENRSEECIKYAYPNLATYYVPDRYQEQNKVAFYNSFIDNMNESIIIIIFFIKLLKNIIKSHEVFKDTS